MEYIQIPLKSILTEITGTFDLYLKRSSKYVLYASKGHFTKNKISELEKKSISEVYISKDDKNNYQNYLLQNIVNILSDTSIELEIRIEIFADVSVHLLQETFESLVDKPMTKMVLKKITDVVKQNIYFLTNENSVKMISDFIGHDYNTFSHSLMVFWLSILLFDECIDLLPKMSKSELDQYRYECGIASLLHDIGKVKIPHYIINKKGKLNLDEFEVIKTHAIHSLAVLVDVDLPVNVVKGIIHHHENYNGTGYPYNLKGDEIPFISRIIRIADVFSAMTSVRTYKESVSAKDTLELMIGEMKGSFDLRILIRFILLLGSNKVV